MLTKNVARKLKRLGQLESEAGDHFRSLSFITEEVGELAQDLNDGNTSHARQEALDVVLAGLGTFYSLGGTDAFMRRHVDKQLKKWSKKIG